MFGNFSNASDDSSYVLATGEHAKMRLDVTDMVYGKGTLRFLEALPLKLGGKIVVVGCGTGNTLEWFSNKVGKHGIVYAVDVSEEQISVAKKRFPRKAFPNIQFIVGDIQDSQSLQFSEIDLIYGRFVLVHLNNPQVALKNLIAILRNGGIIAFEEQDSSTIFSYPNSPSIKNALLLLEKMARKKGVNYNFGSQLFWEINHLGLQNIGLGYSQPTFFKGIEKALLAMSINEAKNNYIDEQLITDKEAEQLIKELEEFTNDENTIIGLGGVFQVAARKI